MMLQLSTHQRIRATSAPSKSAQPSRRKRVTVNSSNKNEDAASTSGRQETGAGLKAVWYGAEIFGKIVGGGKSTATKPAAPACKLSREELLAAIQSDYDAKYFVSGAGDMAAYAEDCEFADPFVSFKGVGRFKQNVGNLGGLMKDIKLDVYSFVADDATPDRVETKWRFSCILDLPWKPLLAAAGGTTHVIDLNTGRVVRHIESWDVEPGKVVAQLFKPAAKVPSNAFETFLLAASDGDALGMWYSVSPLVLRLSLPVIGVSLACKLITGEGLPGFALGAIEGVSYLGFVAAAGTEVIKFAQGMQGGETGTGGRF